MAFFQFPTDIRLMIYLELLVHSEPIVFAVEHSWPQPPSLVKVGRSDLCPAILRVNRQAYAEGCPILYSDNRFQFPVTCPVDEWTPESTLLAPFIRQIGPQAGYLRRIRMNFPSFTDLPCQVDKNKLDRLHVDNLETLQDHCKDLSILELSLRVGDHYALHSLFATDIVASLDSHCKKLPWLRKIVVDVQAYDTLDLSDNLAQKMRDCGWTVDVTMVERPKQAWISGDKLSELDDDTEDLRWW